MDLLIKNAFVAIDGVATKQDVLIRDEKIAEIGVALSATDVQEIDAEGLYLLPGGIDVHTHFDLDVGFDRASDDWYTGSLAAAFGGVTTVVDHMAFGPKGCDLHHQVDVYHELSKDAVIDYGFHGVIQHVNEEVLRDMEKLVNEDGIPSFKVYLTYDDKVSDADLLQVLQRAKELNAVICAHCENDGMIHDLKQELLAEGKTAPKYHPESRPPSCEAEAVWRFLMMAKAADEAFAYVVHLSTQMGLSAIETARALGQKNIGVETCPQYLWLDEKLYDQPDGLKYMMAPPLRHAEDRAALWNGLNDGQVDVIGTDHCPFFYATQKQRGKDDFTKTPCGAPGVETRMRLLFSAFLEGRITLGRFVETCCSNPAEIFGLSDRKGKIKVGLDADLVLFDPTVTGTIQHKDLHEHVDYTPYEGIYVQGAPVMTISRGEIIVKNQEFLGEKGRGNYLKRYRSK